MLLQRYWFVIAMHVDSVSGVCQCNGHNVGWMTDELVIVSVVATMWAG